MITPAMVQHYLDTVWCIAESKYVAEYMIGYTSRAGYKRLAEHRRAYGYQYLVVLANGLTQADAVQLEGALQLAIKADRRRGLYRKYEPHRRDLRHFPSHGPNHSAPDELVHTVYMVWWDAYS